MAVNTVNMPGFCLKKQVSFGYPLEKLDKLEAAEYLALEVTDMSLMLAGAGTALPGMS